MRVLLIILLVFFSYLVSGQTTRPSGIPAQKTTTWHQFGYVGGDSAIIIARRDTTFLPRFSGEMVMRPQDRRLYWYDSTLLRWFKIAREGDPAGSVAWGTISGLLSNQTDLQDSLNTRLRLSDTVTMLAPYLRKADTTSMLAPYWRQYGNSFGDTGRLGTLDNNALALYTNGTRKFTITQTAGTMVQSSSGLMITGTGGAAGGISLSATLPSARTFVSTTDLVFILSSTPSQDMFSFSASVSPTSGPYNLLRLASTLTTFSPTSGNATFSALLVRPSINQTGGANGITRGVYVRPILQSAVDFRAIQIDSGKVVSGPSVLPVLSTLGSEHIVMYNETDSTWYRISPSDLPGGVTPTLQQVATAGNTYTGTIVSAKFLAIDTTDGGTPNAAFLINRSLTSEIVASGHGFRDMTLFLRPTLAYNSFDGNARITGSSNYDHLISFQARQSYGSSGTINDLYGGASLMTITNGGTVTRAYGWDHWDITGTGTVVDQYAYHVQPLTKATRNWAFYSEGTATPSLLRASLGLGLGSHVAPTERLDVSGNVKLTGDIYFNNASANHTIRPASAVTAAPFALTMQGNSSVLSDAAGGAAVEAHANDGSLTAGRLNFFAYSTNPDPNTGNFTFWTRSGVNTATKKVDINSTGHVGINYNLIAPFRLSVNGSVGFEKDSIPTVATTAGVFVLVIDTTATADSNRIKKISPSALAGSATLNNTQIGVGNVSNVLSGSAAFTYDGTTVRQENALGAYSGTSTTALGSTSGYDFRAFVKATPTGADQRLGGVMFGTLDGGSTENMTASIEAWSTNAHTPLVSEQTNLRFYTTAVATRTEVMRITHNFKVGIGITTPSGKLTVGAGDVSQAPFVLTLGTDMTTPTNGAFLYGTVSSVNRLAFVPSGNTPKRFPLMNDVTPTAGGLIRGNGTDFTLLALGSATQTLRVNSGGTDIEWANPNYALFYTDTLGATVANTTTETTIIGTGYGSLSVTGITAGSKIKLSGHGYLSTAAVAGSPQLEVTLGDFSFAYSLSGLASSLTNSPFFYEAEFIPTRLGTGKDYIVKLYVFVANNGAPKQYFSDAKQALIDITSTQLANVTIDWNTADPDNSMTTVSNTVEIFRQ